MLSGAARRRISETFAGFRTRPVCPLLAVATALVASTAALRDLSEFVLDDRELLAVARREDVVQQGRLATSEEPRQNRHGDARVLLPGMGVGVTVIVGMRGHRCLVGEQTRNSEPAII